MLRRVLPFALAALALAIFALPGLAANADDEKGDMHEGKIVRVVGDKLTMTDKDGKEHSHTLKGDVKLTLDNKDCKIEDFRDLKAGTKIRVTTKKGDATTVLKVEALTKGDFPKE